MDNAATSWPKPPQVIQAMASFLKDAGGNPGRSGHRLSIEAGRLLFEARYALAGFFNVPEPMRVVFTQNATHAINIALWGLLKEGDRVVTTSIEHNSVMRPLRTLEKLGVEVVTVQCGPDASLDPDDMARALEEGARLVIINHASNVTGTILPVKEVSHIAHEAGALLMVDAAQTAGCLPIDVQNDGIDLLAFTGHKSLLGPTGTGGLVICDSVPLSDFKPLTQGGTGSNSEYEEQPEDLPDKFESGTPNAVGFAGLQASLDFVTDKGILNIREHERRLTRFLLDGLQDIPGVTLYGPDDTSKRTAIVPFTVEGFRVSEIGYRLDEEFDVLSRVGLHCAPSLHKTIGTFPEGTVRLSPGDYSDEDDIDKVLNAIKTIVAQ